MASGNITSGSGDLPAASVPNPGADRDVERFIEQQLRATRQRVKLVDLANTAMLVIVASLAYLFTLALAEHWLISGGLSSTARFAAFGLLAFVWIYYALRHGFPTLFGRINPLYAAQQIEQSRPTLKNSLINFLQLKQRSTQVAPAIYQAIEHRAANDLSTIEVDHAIDRSRLVRLATALALIVCCGALYKVFSPKDPLRSMARVVAPWADWSAPTRVQIADISPGDSPVFIGQRAKIVCRVTGLWSGESPVLTYSTADGQEVNRQLPLAKAEEANRYFVELPDSSAGMQQDLIYTIAAGDAQTRPFKLNVVTVPTMIVERVKYKYPAYTQLAERVVERQGDLRAIEGTVVTIEALANDSIQSASLDYERDGAALVGMSVRERRASVDVTLRLKPKSTESEHRDYQLLFKTPAGAGNPSPIGYKIETIADTPPLVAIVEPKASEHEPLELPWGRALPVSVSAHDTDFRLGSVTLKFDKNGKPLFTQPLLTYDPKASEETRSARFEGTWIFDSAKYRPLRASDELKPGDVLGVIAEATDNKQPNPNVRSSERLLVRIVAPSSADPPKEPDQLAKNEPRQQDPGQRDMGKQPQNGQQDPAGKNDPGKNDAGKNGDQKNSQPNGEQQPGNQTKNSDQASNNKGGNDPQGGKNEGNQPAGDKQPGENKQDSEKPQPGDNKQNGDNKQPGQNEPQKNDGGGQKPQQQPGNSGDSKPGDKNQPGEMSKPGENPQSGQKQGDQGQGQQPNPQGNLGNEQPGNSKPGEDAKAGDKPQSGDGNQQQADNKQQGGNKPGQQTEQGKVDGPGKRIDPQGNPGEAIEKINQHFGDDKQLAKNEPRQNKPAPGNDSSKPGESQPGDAKSNEPGKKPDQPAGDKPSSDKPGDKPSGEKQAGNNGGQKPSDDKNSQQPSGEKPGDMQPKNDGQPQGQKSAGDAPGDKQSSNQGSDQSGGKPQPGEGGNNKDDQGKKPGEQQSGKSGQNGDQASDSNSSGTPGAGQSGDKPQSTTSPQGANKGRDKEGAESQGDSNKNNEPSAPSRSEKDSNSQGDSSGDQSGGGKKGGGQKSNQAGTGASGTNTAAEQGGSQTAGKGDGPPSDKGGDQAKANQPSGGKSSGEKGPGSQTQSGGDKPGGQDPGQSGQQGDGKSAGPGGQPSSNKNGKAPPQSQQQGPPGSQSDGGMGAPAGDGKPGERTIPPNSLNGPEPGGEDPNLDYARKATELAVQRLKDQLAKGEPDPELLKRLAWTKEDAQKFVEQWDAMMRASKTTGADGNTARRELDERLRSLGLRPSGTQLSGDRAKSDQQRGLREGVRSAPPAEYADQFRAFTTGTGKKTN